MPDFTSEFAQSANSTLSAGGGEPGYSGIHAA
jgi:hypothetical protein